MSKITDLAAAVSADPADVLPVVDVDDTSMASTGTTKKVTVAALLAGADPAGAATAANAYFLRIFAD